HQAIPGNGPVVAVAEDPRKPSRIYAVGPGIFRSDDYGESWQTLERNLRPNLISVDPSDTRRLFVVVTGQLWRSLDEGSTWTQLPVLTPSISSVSIDAGGSLYASTADGRVFKSNDLGERWAAADAGLTRSPTVVTPDVRSAGIAFAAQVI